METAVRVKLDQRLISDIRRRIEEKSTEELAQIYREHNEQQWSEEAFEAIRRILAERGQPILESKPPPSRVDVEKSIEPTAPEPGFEVRTSEDAEPVIVRERDIDQELEKLATHDPAFLQHGSVRKQGEPRWLSIEEAEVQLASEAAQGMGIYIGGISFSVVIVPIYLLSVIKISLGWAAVTGLLLGLAMTVIFRLGGLAFPAAVTLHAFVIMLLSQGRLGAHLGVLVGMFGSGILIAAMGWLGSQIAQPLGKRVGQQRYASLRKQCGVAPGGATTR